MTEIGQFWILLKPFFVSFAWLALVFGAVLVFLSLLVRPPVRLQFAHGFWPRQHFRDVPWIFRDVAILLFIFFGSELLLLPAFVAMGRALAPAPVAVDELTPRQAAEWIGLTVPVGPQLAPVPAQAELAGAAGGSWLRSLSLVTRRWLMIGFVFCRVGFIALALIWLRQSCGARPINLLLTTHQWLANLWRGYAAWILVTLPLFLLFALLQLLVDWVGKSTPHPVDEFMALGLGWFDYLLVVFLAVLLAPVVEEFLLRGIIQPLLIVEPLLADFVILFALLTPVAVTLLDGGGEAWSWGPVVFLLLVGPGYLLFEWLSQSWLPRRGAARGIFAASFFFALLHYSVWPSPVPIFFLGLVLGILAYRTQSLVAGIFCHALFNSVSMLVPLLAKL